MTRPPRNVDRPRFDSSRSTIDSQPQEEDFRVGAILVTLGRSLRLRVNA